MWACLPAQNNKHYPVCFREDGLDGFSLQPKLINFNFIISYYQSPFIKSNLVSKGKYSVYMLFSVTTVDISDTEGQVSFGQISTTNFSSF